MSENSWLHLLNGRVAEVAGFGHPTVTLAEQDDEVGPEQGALAAAEFFLANAHRLLARHRFLEGNYPVASILLRFSMATSSLGSSSRTRWNCCSALSICPVSP